MYPFKIQFVLLGIPLEIGPYALFFFIAVATAVIGCLWFAGKRGFGLKKIALMLLIMTASAIIGARMLNAVVNFSAYYEDPGKFFTPAATGFSLYGGGIAAVVSGWIFCRIKKINVYRLGDTFIPFLGISVALMRVGCFLQGCCFGVETELPWGLKFPLLSPAHLHQMELHGNFMEVYPVHPTQLYELAAGIILSIIAFRLLGKKLKDGTTMLIIIIAFSAFRLFNGFLRVNPEGFSMPVYFYPLLYLGIIATCLFFIRRRNVVELSHA